MEQQRIDEMVRSWYASNPKGEWKRLKRNAYHELEFSVTMHFLEKYLPESGLVLDAGGGPRAIHSRACEKRL